MNNAEYLYKIWMSKLGRYKYRANGCPFYKTRKEAEKVAKRWLGEVRKFKIERIIE